MGRSSATIYLVTVAIAVPLGFLLRSPALAVIIGFACAIAVKAATSRT